MNAWVHSDMRQPAKRVHNHPFWMTLYSSGEKAWRPRRYDGPEHIGPTGEKIFRKEGGFLELQASL